MIRLLFPLRNPMKLDTLILGGISTSMWIWSGHTSASIIVTPFHPHNSHKIFPISARFSLYNTFRRYFGANTIWYLQFQLLCAKLLLSFILNVLLLVSLAVARPQAHSTPKGVFLSHSSLKLFSLHRHCRWLFSQNKKEPVFDCNQKQVPLLGLRYKKAPVVNANAKL